MGALQLSAPEATVTISSGGVDRLRRGHLWVYRSDVIQNQAADELPFVRVIDAAQNTLGYALFSQFSQIQLRLFTRGDIAPTVQLLENRLTDSIHRRTSLAALGNACRLVYSEADLLPSIIVDRYDDVLVVQTLSAGADRLKPLILDILLQSLRPRIVVERNDVAARKLEGLEETKSVLFGDAPGEIWIEENGMHFLVDPLHGQKTGFYLDQRGNRIRGSQYAHGTALDCFTNSGAFAVHFASRCSQVFAVDISEPSLRLAARNADRNNVENITFIHQNVFDHLRALEASGEKYDTICIDPPAFAKNRNSLKGAIRGYKEVNLRAMKLLRSGGILITSSCSYQLDESSFLRLLCRAARDAHRYLQIVERGSQPSDHPILATMPETNYLKCFVMRVI